MPLRFSPLCSAALLVGGLLPGCFIRPEDPPEVVPAVITVRIQNETDLPLDPEIYVGPIAEGLSNLFTAGNRRTDFGYGNIGVVPGGEAAEFYLDCGDEVFIATRGGAFGEDLKDPRGRGRQLVLEEGLNVECRDTVTFRFASAEDTLLVSYAVTR